jgi:CRISPR-associated protein Cmr6
MSSRRETLRGLEPNASTHAGLWLEKCLPDVEERGPGRQAHFDQLEKIGVSSEYRRYFQRWRDSVAALEPYTGTAEATVQGRMVVGLGAESVLETSIALHRTFGVPYIPGSALKGLTAAAAHTRLEDPQWRKSGKNEEIGMLHRTLFGDQESGGYVTFHDALWIPNGDRLPLDLDVMTVHHPDYYQSKDDAPAADWDNPNPVAFVTAHGKYLLALTGPEDWVKVAIRILVEALQRDGVGAKTAAGYGRMSVPQQREAEAINWAAMIQGIGFGNAGDVVPKVLNRLGGEDKKRAAGVIIEKLGRGSLRNSKNRDKEWVKQLFAAFGE